MNPLQVLASIPDGAFSSGIAVVMIYMLNTYVTKKDLVERFNKLESEISQVKSEYVSKEKLSDVLKPIHDSLEKIEKMLEIYVRSNHESGRN